jgi:transposase
MAIIAETGLDMSRFPTAAHLVSWAGLAPVTRQSGPRSRKPGKGQGDAYLKGYCTQAAAGAAGTATFLGERLTRLSRRIGALRARCAVARSILGQVAGARYRYLISSGFPAVLPVSGVRDAAWGRRSCIFLPCCRRVDVPSL